MTGLEGSAVTSAISNPPPPPRLFAPIDRSPSPRAKVSTPSRLPSITHHQPLDQFEDFGFPRGSSTVFGFSPPSTTAALPGSPSAANVLLGKTSAGAGLPAMTSSPELFSFHGAAEPTSPLGLASSPRGLGSPRPQHAELLPRSRRNSAAIVSISLSSRSRSRTPRDSSNALPTRDGSGTTSSANTPKGEHPPPFSQLNGGNGAPASGHIDAWAPGVDDLNPDGGILFDDDDDEDDRGEAADVFRFDNDYNNNGRTWTADSEASRAADVLRPGMIFGEGLEFEGDIITPAVGRLDGSDRGVPLRRDGSYAGVPRANGQRPQKTYEVIRQLGSGSYAVVYLVRERGGRRREYALKCLSKHDLEEDQLETQLFEASIHLSLPIHQNLVTLHETLQTRNWLFLMLELCPGEDLFYWLERSRDASPPPTNAKLPDSQEILSSSRLPSSSIPFSASQLFSNFPSSYSNSPNAFSPNGFNNGSYNNTGSFKNSPASLLFAHHNGSSQLSSSAAMTPPTPSLLSAFSSNTLLSQRRLRLIASMFSQMCDAVAVCHSAGVSHRDIKPENFICCDSVELEAANDGPYDDSNPDFGPQAKRKVIVKLTDFGLSTTDQDSGDVECGSKPYMSYECRNNLGPSYKPAPADVWSLGIVLINMLFHRNPWKDPTEGDPNFDTFLMDPVTFFQSKFSGIGKEVATYLATHVLCINVDDRVSARELGNWIKKLPDMIGGKRALHALKVQRLESRAKQAAADKGLFVKSPVTQTSKTPKSGLASGLTLSAPVTQAPSAEPPAVPVFAPTHFPPSAPAPTLSSLPPPSELAAAQVVQIHKDDFPHVAPTPELENDEVRSATTVDEHPTPTDMSALVSPEPTESGDGDFDQNDTPDNQKEFDERSMSTTKRRKRGVRKGKAAQAAAAAAAAGDNPTQEERDAFLKELVNASEELARDLSTKRALDINREADFPPLGTSPAQAAAARKSRWKEFLSMSKGNPQLEALANRVAERESSSGGNWSAPAQLQQGPNGSALSRLAYRKQTATTTSSGFSSQLSSVVSVSSSATASSVADEDEDWRRTARERERERDRKANTTSNSSASTTVPPPKDRRRETEDSNSRSREAALAAAAIASGMAGPMGSFGKPSHLGRPLHPQNDPHRHPQYGHPVKSAADRFAPPTSSIPAPAQHKPKPKPQPSKEHSSFVPPLAGSVKVTPQPRPKPIVITPPTAEAPLPTSSSQASNITITPASPMVSNSPSVTTGDSPNRPKVKGQISSLAKMLGGLKTKGGRD